MLMIDSHTHTYTLTLTLTHTQNLQRLTQQYLSKREIKSPPEVNGYDRTENR